MHELWRLASRRRTRSSSDAKETEHEYAQYENPLLAVDCGVDGADFGACTGNPILHAGLQHFGRSADHSELGRQPNRIGLNDRNYHHDRSNTGIRLWTVHDQRHRDSAAIGYIAENFVQPNDDHSEYRHGVQ